jgi:DNA-directed RNA polymerase specialized sigma24 family protein
MNGAMPSRHSQNLEHPDFEALLRRFDPDTKRGIEKYENLRRRLVKFFEWNGCFSASEDLANLTLDTVARKPSDLVIRDVGAYSYGAARNILSEFQRRRGRERHFDDSPEVQGSAPESDPERTLVTAIDLQMRVDCLNSCLRKLKTDDRNLVLDYYSSEASTHIIHRQNLAERIGVSINTLRVRVNRIRRTLEECVKGCRANARS